MLKLAAAGCFLIAAFTTTAQATDYVETLVTECHVQLNLGDSGCACVGARAEEVLNENQQGLVAAMVTKNEAAAAALRANMTMDEMTGAANFMMDTPTICAGQ